MSCVYAKYTGRVGVRLATLVRELPAHAGRYRRGAVRRRPGRLGLCHPVTLGLAGDAPATLRELLHDRQLAHQAREDPPRPALLAER